MSPQTKNGPDSPSAFQTYTELSRDKPFSFIPEGSCSKEHIKIWAGQFPVARNTGEAEQPLCALSQGLGCQGQLIHPGLAYLQSPLWPEPGLGHPRLFHQKDLGGKRRDAMATAAWLQVCPGANHERRRSTSILISAKLFSMLSEQYILTEAPSWLFIPSNATEQGAALPM